MLTSVEIATILKGFAKAIPTFAPDFNDPEMAQLWQFALGNFTREEILKAFPVILRSEKTFPSMARVLEVLDAKRDEGFDVLVRLVAAHGSYKAPTVSYQMAATIERLGGWQSICAWKNEDLPFRRREFEQAYGEAREKITMSHPSQLPPIAISGSHGSTTSNISMKTSTLISASEEVVAEQPQGKKIDWEAILEVHKDDVDLRLPDKLKDQGFFKLLSAPGYYFRYMPGMKPSGVPYKFVEYFDHVMKTSGGASP